MHTGSSVSLFVSPLLNSPVMAMSSQLAVLDERHGSLTIKYASGRSSFCSTVDTGGSSGAVTNSVVDSRPGMTAVAVFLIALTTGTNEGLEAFMFSQTVMHRVLRKRGPPAIDILGSARRSVDDVPDRSFREFRDLG